MSRHRDNAATIFPSSAKSIASIQSIIDLQRRWSRLTCRNRVGKNRYLLFAMKLGRDESGPEGQSPTPWARRTLPDTRMLYRQDEHEFAEYTATCLDRTGRTNEALRKKFTWHQDFVYQLLDTHVLHQPSYGPDTAISGDMFIPVQPNGNSRPWLLECQTNATDNILLKIQHVTLQDRSLHLRLLQADINMLSRCGL